MLDVRMWLRMSVTKVDGRRCFHNIFLLNISFSLLWQINPVAFQSLHGCCQYEWTRKHVTNKFYIIWNITGDSAILVEILAPNINITWYPIIFRCQTFVCINQWFRDQTYWTIRDIIETHYERGRVVAIYHKSNEEQQQWHFDASEVQLYSMSRKDVWIFVRIGNDYNCLNISCCNSWWLLD